MKKCGNSRGRWKPIRRSARWGSPTSEMDRSSITHKSKDINTKNTKKAREHSGNLSFFVSFVSFVVQDVLCCT